MILFKKDIIRNINFNNDFTVYYYVDENGTFIAEALHMKFIYDRRFKTLDSIKKQVNEDLNEFIKNVPKDMEFLIKRIQENIDDKKLVEEMINDYISFANLENKKYERIY
jgi:hypothetical protein